MSAAATHLAARLATPGSPAQAALLRVALGLHLLGVFGSPGYDLLLAIEPGLHPQAGLLGGPALFELVAPIAGPLRTLGMVSAALLIVGLGGRLTAAALLACFLGTQAYWFGATLFHEDWIYFAFPILTFACVRGPTALSLDALIRARLRRPRDRDRERREARFVVEGWVFWIGFVYAAAGVAKLFPLSKGALWLTGRASQHFALEFIRESPALVLLDAPLFDYDALWLFALGSVATVVVELGAAALWFTRRAYLPVAVAIFGLHLGIWLIGIPAFIGMFAVLALALLPARGFARADAWLDGAESTGEAADDPISEASA